MDMVTFREYWKSRRERNEKFSTLVVVSGVQLVVVVYDVFLKTTHELFISVEVTNEESIVLRIPEMCIREKDKLADVVAGVMSKLYEAKTQMA